MRYVAHLARSISTQSLSQYLNVIRIIHLELGYPNPLVNNYMLDTVLKGVARAKGLTVVKKLPITPGLLLKIRAQLDLNKTNNVVFWAVCLMLFFTWLRKSNVLSNYVRVQGNSKIIKRGDFFMSNNAPQLGLFVNIAATKTIQFKERALICPLPYLPRHPLCPVTAIIKAFKATPCADPGQPAFQWLDNRNQLIPVTYLAFQGKLRDQLALCGVDPAEYSSHSFRRGGCSWGLSQGLSTDTLKLLGDWKSRCVEEYMTVQLKDKVSAMKQFSKSLPSN